MTQGHSTIEGVPTCLAGPQSGLALTGYTHPHKVYSQTAEVYNKSNKTKLKSESHT